MQLQVLVSLTAGLLLPSLLQAAVPATWPYLSCKYTKDCNASPYFASLSSVQQTLDQRSTMCFTISAVEGGCNPNGRCCQALQASLYRLSLRTNPACKNKISSWTFNGQPDRTKTSAFHVYGDDGVYTFGNLGLNATTAPGTRICINFKAGSDCGKPEVFWKNEYFFTERMAQNCCPMRQRMVACVKNW